MPGRSIRRFGTRSPRILKNWASTRDRAKRRRKNNRNLRNTDPKEPRTEVLNGVAAYDSAKGPADDGITPGVTSSPDRTRDERPGPRRPIRRDEPRSRWSAHSNLARWR